MTLHEEVVRILRSSPQGLLLREVVRHLQHRPEWFVRWRIRRTLHHLECAGKLRRLYDLTHARSRYALHRNACTPAQEGTLP